MLKVQALNCVKLLSKSQSETYQVFQTFDKFNDRINTGLFATYTEGSTECGLTMPSENDTMKAQHGTP